MAQEISDKLKVWLLERILKSLYEAKDIRYIFHNMDEDNPNNSHGFLTLVDIHKWDCPKIVEYYDEGLSDEIDTEMGDAPEWLIEIGADEKRAILNYEIWFTFDPYEEIERLKKELEESKT
jgi:hypothetical protein